MRPAGASRLTMPGVAGATSPFSIAMVTVPMVPWPHIGRQPLTSMNRMPMSQSARLEHQRLADPVVVLEEVEPPLAHGGALEQGRAATDQPHRVAAGMAVEARKSVDQHGACLRRRHE